MGKNSSSAKAVPLKPDSARLLLRSERRQCYHRTGSSLLNLINPHVGDARLSESKRHRGLRRNVDHSATDARAPANDRDDDAKAVVEVDDTDLRPHRQAAMRRTTMHVGRNARPFPTACSLPKTRGAKRAQASSNSVATAPRRFRKLWLGGTSPAPQRLIIKMDARGRGSDRVDGARFIRPATAGHQSLATPRFSSPIRAWLPRQIARRECRASQASTEACRRIGGFHVRFEAGLDHGVDVYRPEARLSGPRRLVDLTTSRTGARPRLRARRGAV